MQEFVKKQYLRQKNDQPFITDHHHYILDCDCEKIENAILVNNTLHNIPGVVETGLFIDMANQVIAGHEDGKIEVIKYR